MEFAEFVAEIDRCLTEAMPTAFGHYQGPHVSFFQFGAVTARVREGSADDAELTIVGEHDQARVVVASDVDGAARLARLIVARFAVELPESAR